jgi:uncharacterized membrane protein YgcG
MKRMKINLIPIIDEINLLSDNQKNELSHTIKLKHELGSEITLLLISSTGDKTIDEYSLEQAERIIGREKY